MKFVVEKPKTWKGLSYVLKSSVLQNAITERGLDCNVHLSYWTPQGDNKSYCILLEVSYQHLAAITDFHQSFSIRSGVVHSTERKRFETIMNDEIIPKLIDWMESKISMPDNSTKKRGGFFALFKDDKLLINH